MGFGLREILFLGVVAVLLSVYVPAHGLDQEEAEADDSDVIYDESENAETETDPNEISTGRCSRTGQLSFHCGANLTTKMMGKKLKLEPELNVEFVPKNVTIQMVCSNRGKQVFTHQIGALDLLPTLCIPIPSMPIFGICLKFKNQTVSMENKSLHFCAKLTLDLNNPMPRALLPLPENPLPSLKLGCFDAAKNGIKYTRPTYKIPKSIQKLMASMKGVGRKMKNAITGKDKKTNK